MIQAGIDIKMEIDELVKDFRSNRLIIDRRRVQYGDALRLGFQKMDFEERGLLLMGSLEDYILYITSFAEDAMPFNLFGTQNMMISALSSLTKEEFDEQNLVLNLCPGSGKSSIVQFWESWCFARNADIQFKLIANSYDNAKSSSEITRSIIASEAWSSMFGVELDNSKLSNVKTSKTDWRLKSGGLKSGFSASGRGRILGANAGNPNTPYPFKGALVLDDFQGEDAMKSAYIRQQDIISYLGAAKSRRRDPSISIVNVQQRLHSEDLTAYIETNESDSYRIVRIPALMYDEHDKPYSTAPSTISVEELLRMQEKSLDFFLCMYQQNPPKAGGKKFRQEWISYYDTIPAKEELLLTFVTTDFAFKKNEQADRTVFCLWGLHTNGYLYLLRLCMGRWNTGEAKEEFLSFWAEARIAYGVVQATIEKITASLLFKESLIERDPTIAFEELVRGAATNKVVRANDSIPFVSSKRVLFPKNHKDIQTAVNEVLSFSDDLSHAHDDFCDNLFDAVQKAFGAYQANSIFI